MKLEVSKGYTTKLFWIFFFGNRLRVLSVGVIGGGYVLVVVKEWKVQVRSVILISSHSKLAGLDWVQESDVVNYQSSFKA